MLPNLPPGSCLFTVNASFLCPSSGLDAQARGEGSLLLGSILSLSILLSLLSLSPSWAQPAGWAHFAKFDFVYPICPSKSPGPMLA